MKTEWIKRWIDFIAIISHLKVIWMKVFECNPVEVINELFILPENCYFPNKMIEWIHKRWNDSRTMDKTSSVWIVGESGHLGQVFLVLSYRWFAESSKFKQHLHWQKLEHPNRHTTHSHSEQTKQFFGKKNKRQPKMAIVLMLRVMRWNAHDDCWCMLYNVHVVCLCEWICLTKVSSETLIWIDLSNVRQLNIVLSYHWP